MGSLPHGHRNFENLPVIDATHPLLLHVLTDDISKASLKEPQNCAVARACKRELHAKEVRVHLGRVYIRTNESNWVRYETPRPMRTEIVAFDRGGKFEPGTFELKVPAQRRPENAGTRSKAKHKKHRTRQKPAILKNVRLGPSI